MATIDNTGITPVSLTGYKTILESRFREEFGQDLSVEPETPVGQIISVAALMLAEADENVVSISNGLSVGRATGIQLDDLATLLHIERIPETFTQVECTLTGVAGTAIPFGSRVRKENGDEFELLSTVNIGAEGSVVGNFQAVDSGPVMALAGTVNTIVTLIAGLEAVSNAANQTRLGVLAENDNTYRSRYRNLTARNGLTTVDALKALLFEVGATKVRIERNDTAADVTRQGLTISARGIMAIVLGGASDSIASAVLSHKPLGVAMSGNTPHSQGAANGTYQSVVQTPLRVTVVVETQQGSTFPGDGADRIRNAIVAYASGNFSGGEQQFETDGFAIGEIISTDRLRVPVLSVPGHEIDTLTVRVKGSGDATTDTALPATPNLNVLYTIAAADVSVTVNIV